MIDYHFTKVICLIWNASQSHWQMSLEALHTLCSDSILSHGTGLLTIVIHSLLTQKTSIKGCLLVFTLFIHGLSPLRSRLFFRPSSHNQGISSISAQGAVVIKLKYTTYILGCQCFMPNIIWVRWFIAYPYFELKNEKNLYMYLSIHPLLVLLIMSCQVVFYLSIGLKIILWIVIWTGLNNNVWCM